MTKDKKSERHPYDAVVISGGGTNGVVALGTLHYYHEKGLYDPSIVKEYSGSSVGSIICLLLACGYYPMEIFQEIYAMDNFFTLQDCHSSMWDILQKMGIMSIRGLTDKIEEMVKKRLGFVPTLSKLKEMTGKRLCVTGGNITQQGEDDYTPETHPNMGCVGAISVSCCLPLIFERIKYKGNFVVDGGLVNNFPWELITEGRNILGIVIMIENDGAFPDDQFIGYLYRAMTLPINTLTEMRCQMAPDNVHVVKVLGSGSSVLQFTMTHERKMDMFLNGYKFAEEDENTEYIKVEDWDFFHSEAKLQEEKQKEEKLSGDEKGFGEFINWNWGEEETLKI